ncbi:DNA-binding transcriptional LysR family regulator [Natronospira proteinivora]|uniref:DNA-binding transcriptional LysR family regulator n=1 Tax=Natronospira proteinivora TaxID=1807133 RepID=A0ABT1G688_9GAMM|nr:LysR family transcriptional regulator [Natronospira proteinivora]MCP1726810.1 DNA-binding transcriptional LysR family regulator [Natronospira proteinivora]
MKQRSRANRLTQLRGFCATAQLGSISAAADKLELSQPSVSMQIQALEKEFGTLLFERRGPRIQLTPEGENLLEIALPMVESLDTLPETFAARCGNPAHGDLDIAAGESTLLYLLPTFVERFAHEYPAVQFRLHNVTGRDGLNMLRADEVDFAVGSMVDVPDDLSYRPIFHYEPMLITAPAHPLAKRKTVSLEDISRYGLILPPRHLSTWRMVKSVFEQHELAYDVKLEAGGWEVIKKYVEMNLGISIVTDICLDGGESLHVRPMGAYFKRRSYGVVTRRGKFLSPQAKAFIRLMDERFFSRSGNPA